MAPKATPAAKSVTKGTKHRANLVKKRPAAASSAGSAGGRRVTASQCRSIVAALEGAEELPRNVRDMLASLVGQSLSDSQHPYQEAAMAVVGDALTDIEARLSSEWQEAKAIHEAEEDKPAREEAVQQAELYMSEQKQSIDQLKQSIKDSSQALKTAQDELHGAKAAQKSMQTEQKRLEAKKMQLQTVDKDTYRPLKDTSASGQQGNKMLKILRKTGKVFNFHEVLMDVLPVVLKKQPDRRRTFDGITMQQVEHEFSKHGAALEAALREREAVIEESSTAVQAANTAVDDAKTQHSSKTQELTQAEENLIMGKTTLMEARRRVRTYDSDMRKTAKDLANKAAKLQAFQQGPMAAFRELSKRAAPMEVEASEVSTTELDSVSNGGVPSANTGEVDEDLTQTVPDTLRIP